MPILGPKARLNPLVAADDWEDQLPRKEARAEVIDTPQGKLTWDLYCTGGEGYVGRDGIKSGGIFGLDGQPYIMTPDITYPTHDEVHWWELRDLVELFEKEKIPDTINICFRTLKVENKSDIYFQGYFEEDGQTITVFKTYRTFIVGFGKPDADLREMYVGMRRVADFFLITTFWAGKKLPEKTRLFRKNFWQWTGTLAPGRTLTLWTWMDLPLFDDETWNMNNQDTRGSGQTTSNNEKWGKSERFYKKTRLQKKIQPAAFLIEKKI